MHPWWYYNLFDHIFGATRDYKREIAMLAAVSPLVERDIEEVGVGLGNHLVEVLQYRPRSVVGVDIDGDACHRARNRFSLDGRVSIIEGDGFDRKSKAEVVYCFYCVPQQTHSVSEAVSRLTHLAMCAGDGREAWVEVMDVDRHLATNLHRSASEVFRDGDDFLQLRTTASKTGTEIIYSGVIESRPTEYRVPIAKLSAGMISDAAERASASFECYPLSASNRRALVRFF